MIKIGLETLIANVLLGFSLLLGNGGDGVKWHDRNIPLRAYYNRSGAEYTSLVKRLDPELIFTGTFYDSKNRSVGKIVDKGQILTNGISTKGVYLVQDKAGFRVSESPAGDFSMGGFVSVYNKGQPDYNGYDRLIQPRFATRRVWVVFKDNKWAVRSGKATLSRVIELCKYEGVEDCALCDGGGSSFLYNHGTYNMRPYRKVITAIYCDKVGKSI